MTTGIADRWGDQVAAYNRNGSHVAAAMMVAKIAHAGQVDKQGVDYCEHVKAVAAAVEDCGTIAVAAAWLHDTVEDTPVTRSDLVALDFPLVVVEIVDAVTRRDFETYSAFIDRVIAAGHLPRQVKLADLGHNLDDSRGPRPDSLTLRYEEARGRIGAAEIAWMMEMRRS